MMSLAAPVASAVPARVQRRARPHAVASARATSLGAGWAHGGSSARALKARARVTAPRRVMAAPAQALHDDGFAPLGSVCRRSAPAGERAPEGTAQRVIDIDLPQQGPHARAQNDGPGRFMPEFILLARKALTGRQVGLERR